MDLEVELRADRRIERLMKNPNWSVAAEAAIQFLINGTECPIASWRKSSTWAQVDMVYKEIKIRAVDRSPKPAAQMLGSGAGRLHSNIAYPIQLTVSVTEARKLIEHIPHDTCRVGAQRHWNVADDATVQEQSVNWLFCWGKTGMGSPAAAEEAKRVFNAIMPITFSRYDELVDHEQARMDRYR